jgi:hypothetical protein
MAAHRPHVEHEPMPGDWSMPLKFSAALLRLAYEDAALHKLMFEVQHLLKPRSVLCQPKIVERVMALMTKA